MTAKLISVRTAYDLLQPLRGNEHVHVAVPHWRLTFVPSGKPVSEIVQMTTTQFRLRTLHRLADEAGVYDFPVNGGDEVVWAKSAYDTDPEPETDEIGGGGDGDYLDDGINDDELAQAGS